MQLVQRCKLGSEPRLTSEAALFAALDTHHYDPDRRAVSGHAEQPRPRSDVEPRTDVRDQHRRHAGRSRTERHDTVSATRSSRTSIDAVPPAGRCSRSITTPPTRRTKPPSAHLQPGRPIALMTLYTPNIGSYARVAERNFRRYCDTHGYTLYVHRDIPAEIGLNATGNWFAVAAACVPAASRMGRVARCRRADRGPAKRWRRCSKGATGCSRTISASGRSTRA